MSLADTKERALPHPRTDTLEDRLVFLKHLALYNFAKDFTVGRRALDLGCGEGYGADELARVASIVIAMDSSVNAVTHARHKYVRPNLFFIVGDAQQLPFRDRAFEATISFEVIEHIEQVKDYLNEVKRVCDGTALISTPNRSFRLLPFQRPWNRFHKREYDCVGLGRVLRQEFANVKMHGIAATPEIMRIEKERVMQKPWIAYPRMLAQIVLPRAVYEGIKRLKPKHQRPLPNRAPRSELKKFSVADFAVSEDCLADCINLVALCSPRS